MSELKIIGKNIARLRKENNFTQEDLSGLAEIDRSYLSDVEHGKENISIKTLVRIANALECKLSDLIE